MHPAIIIGTVRSLWTWLWGRYHVPQNVFLVVAVVVVVLLLLAVVVAVVVVGAIVVVLE